MRSYSHLSEDERDQIGVLRAAGRSMGAIARALGRAKATISRELQRNALPSGGYSILEREAALRLFVGGPARRGMDARTDLRLVEIRERIAAAGRQVRTAHQKTCRHCINLEVH